MRVIVRFSFMNWMFVVMRSMLTCVLVVMNVGISAMGMLVQVFMNMLMGVAVRMLVRVRQVPMWVLMGMHVCVFMGMQVLVFMFTFHFLPSFRLPSLQPSLAQEFKSAIRNCRIFKGLCSLHGHGTPPFITICPIITTYGEENEI